MTESVFVVLCLVGLAWALTSDRLARWNITGPLVFTAAGFLVANPQWGPLPVDIEAPSVHLLAEVTLALLLFSDASRVNVAKLRHDLGVPARLLGIALPITVVLGSLLAAWLFSDLGWALAAFVGAALAPTDAALSAPVIEDERISVRVRRALNVESGVNDGIVTPIVVLALAIAASEFGMSSEESEGVSAIAELTFGLVVGLGLGFCSAKCLAFAWRRKWLLHGGRRLATLATALGSFALAQVVGGNGFIAAFVAGVAFGAALPRDAADDDRVGELPELVGEALALGVWFLFGAALVPVAFEYFSLSTLVYAILSLTVIRMLPVALGLIGTRLDRSTVLFMGWFGPRGLASVVFALLAVEQLEGSPAVGPAVSLVAFTVMLSVILHGVSAGPLSRRYAVGEGKMPPEGDTIRSARRYP